MPGDDNTKAVIEALLFASERPLRLEQIKGVLGHLTTPQLRILLEELRAEYENSDRGINITEVAGGFQMIAAPSFSSFLKKLYQGRRIDKLSKPALETLAIIAYKQPVTKMEIELLRNVNIDGVVKNLLDKNLVRIAGRKRAPGRPLVFGTTRRFLEHFALRSLEDLPKMQDFSKLSGQDQEVRVDNQIRNKETEEINDASEPAQAN